MRPECRGIGARENIGVDSAGNTDHNWLIHVPVEVSYFRGEDVDSVSSTGECQLRKDVVDNAAKVAADEQLAQTGAVDRVP